MVVRRRGGQNLPKTINASTSRSKNRRMLAFDVWSTWRRRNKKRRWGGIKQACSRIYLALKVNLLSSCADKRAHYLSILNEHLTSQQQSCGKRSVFTFFLDFIIVTMFAAAPLDAFSLILFFSSLLHLFSLSLHLTLVKLYQQTINQAGL